MGPKTPKPRGVRRYSNNILISLCSGCSSTFLFSYAAVAFMLQSLAFVDSHFAASTLSWCSSAGLSLAVSDTARSFPILCAKSSTLSWVRESCVGFVLIWVHAHLIWVVELFRTSIHWENCIFNPILVQTHWQLLKQLNF